MADSSSEEKGTIELKEEIKQNALSKVASLKPDANLKPDASLEEDIKQKNICGINLKKEFEQLKCSDENLYSKECNKFMLKKELIENKFLN